MTCKICETWASSDISMVVLTGHHENCPLRHNNIVNDAWKSLVVELVHGIECWAADEDGVHDELWDAYKMAKAVLGEPVKETK